jgi:hypothetical protein
MPIAQTELAAIVADETNLERCRVFGQSDLGRRSQLFPPDDPRNLGIPPIDVLCCERPSNSGGMSNIIGCARSLEYYPRHASTCE